MDEHPAPSLERPEELAAWLVAQRGAIYRSAWRVLGDDAAAEDAAQDALVRVLEDPRRLALAADRERYLRRMAVNAALDQLRSEKSRKRREGERGAAVDLEQAARLESAAASAADRLAVREALATLPDDLRLPLVLRYAEGLSLEEIGDALGCSAPAIHARLRKGEGQLRRRLGEGRPLAVAPLCLPRLIADQLVPVPPARLLDRMARAIDSRLRPARAQALADPVAVPERPGCAGPSAPASAPLARGLLLLALVGAAFFAADRAAGPADPHARSGVHAGTSGGAAASRTVRRPSTAAARATASGASSEAADGPGQMPDRSRAGAGADTRLARGAPGLSGTLRGLVVDDLGQPIEGAFALAQALVLGRGRPPARAEAVTDAEGRFELTVPLDDPRGQAYAVQVGAHFHAAVDLGWQEVRPDAAAPAPEPLRVVLRRLAPEGAATTLGLVLDPDGQPVRGATVSLTREQPIVPSVAYPAALDGRAVTDAGGRFRILSERAGERRLRVDPPPASGLCTRDERIDLVTGTVTERTIRLARGLALAGRLRGADGQPLALAVTAILLEPQPLPLPDPQQPAPPPPFGAADGVTPSAGVRHATAGPDGAFLVDGLAPGRYALSIAGDAQHADARVLAETGSRDLDVRLKRRDDERDLGLGGEIHGEVIGPEGRLRVPPGALELYPSVDVFGSAGGAESVDACLVDLLFPLNPGWPLPAVEAEARALEARLAAERFHLTGLAPDRYVLILGGRTPLYAPDGQRVHARAFVASIALAEGEVRSHLRIQVDPAGVRAAGVVRDASTGQPLAGAYVVLLGPDAGPSPRRLARADALARAGQLGLPAPASGEALTDTRGRFAIDGIPGGLALRVAAIHPDYAPGTSTLFRSADAEPGADALRIDVHVEVELQERARSR